MGRGRQKAKHTKLARELKGYSPTVDYAALEDELARTAHDGHEQDEIPDDEDPY